MSYTVNTPSKHWQLVKGISVCVCVCVCVRERERERERERDNIVNQEYFVIVKNITVR